MTEQPSSEPTPAELQQMAEAAMKTAEEAKSAAEAKKEVAATVKEEADAKGVELTKEQAEMIATVTIAEFERRGAFPDAEAAESELGAQAPPAPGGEAPPAPGGEQSPGGEPPAAPPEEPPRSKSLAERFANRG